VKCQACHWWQDLHERKTYAMVALIVLLIIIGLVVYGLERNRRRGGLSGRLAGSSDVQDRDAERVLAELRVARG
jgi:hypothetical protein